MADATVRRVYEIDAKLGANALAAVREMQSAMAAHTAAVKDNTTAIKGNDAAYGSLSKGEQFVKNLKEQLATLGFTKRELLEFAAAQHKVEEEALPLIAALDKETAALEKQAAAAAASSRYTKSKDSAASDIIGTLTEKRDTLALGSPEDAELYKAALLGILGPVKALHDEITLLTAAQNEQQTIQRKITADIQAQIAAENQRVESGKRLIATLREKREVEGLTDEQQIQRQGNRLGVGDETARELALLRSKRAILAESATAEDAARAKTDEAVTAERRRIEGGVQLVAQLKERIATLGQVAQSEEEVLRKKAIGADVSASTIDPLLAQLRERKAAQALLDDANRESVRSEDEAATADLRHSTSTQELIAQIRAKITALRESAAASRAGITSSTSTGDLADQTAFGKQASALGSSGTVAPLIEELKTAQVESLKAAEKLREFDRVQEESAAAARNRAAAGEQLIAQMRNEINTIGLDAEALRAQKAEATGVKVAYDQLLPELQRAQEANARAAHAARETANAEREQAAAVKNAKVAYDSYVQSLEQRKTLAGFKGDKAAIEEYKASLVGATQQTKALRAEVVALENAQNKHGGSSSLGVSSGVGRELLVLIHEASQGQIKRFGGSLIVLGEQVNFSKFLFSALGLAVTGASIALVGFGLAVIKGAAEQENFRKSLQLTGNFAGQTEDSFNVLTSAVQSGAHITVGAAHEITQALLSTGRFGPSSIKSVALAIGSLTKLTGESGEDIAKAFDGITKDTAKWAQDANEKYHFLDLAVFNHIKALQEQGKTEEAVVVAADALNVAINSRAEKLGYFAARYRELKEAISGVTHALSEVGKEATTGDLLATAERQLAVEKNRKIEELNFFEKGAIALSGARPGDKGPNQARIDAAEQLVGQLRLQVKLEEDIAAQRATYSKLQEEGIAASERENAARRTLGTGSRLEEWLRQRDLDRKRIRDANEALRKEGTELPFTDSKAEVEARKGIASDKLYAEEEIAARKKYGDKEDQKAETAFQARERALVRETAAIIDQIAQYKALGEAINNSNAAKLREEFKDPTNQLSKILPSEQAQLISNAQKKDAAESLLRGEKGLTQLTKEIALIKAEGEARSENVRDTQFAAAVGKIDRDLERAGDEDLIKRRNAAIAQLKVMINLRADSEARKDFKAEAARVDDNVKKLEEEISLIGLNTLEHRKATEVLRLEEIARKQLVASPGLGAEINANLARNIDVITAAVTRSYEEFRKFDTGAKEAFAAYAEAATNAAAFSKNVITNGLKDMEDALVEFYKTGKFSLTKFLQNLADEFIRQTFRMQIKKLLDEDSVKENIDKALDIVKGAFFPEEGNVLKIAAPATAAAKSDFNDRRYEADRTASIADANAAFTNLVSSGITPASTSLNIFTTAVDSATAAMKFIADTKGGVAGIADSVTLPTVEITGAKRAAKSSLASLPGESDIGPILRQEKLAIQQRIDAASGDPEKLDRARRDLEQLRKEATIQKIDLEKGADAAKATEATKAVEANKKLISSADDSATAIAEFKDSAVTPTDTALAALSTTVGASDTSLDLLGSSSSSTATDMDVLAASTTSSSSSFDSATASGYALSAALDAAAASAGTSSATSIGGEGVAGLLDSLFAAQGGIVSQSRGLYSFDSGGLMTPYGKLKPEYESTGGVTNQPRLAVFGEGRKPEAYIPLEDGKTIQVSVGSDQRAYVPLSGGRKIPVTLNSTKDTGAKALNYGGVMPYVDKNKYHTYFEGGVTSYVEKDKYHTYAKGGVTSYVEKDKYHTYAKGGVTSTSSYVGKDKYHTYIEGGVTSSIEKNKYHTYASGGIMHSPLATFASGGIMHSPLATFASGGIMHSPLASGSMRMPEYAYASGGIMRMPEYAYASGGIMHAPVSAFASGGIMRVPMSAYALGGIMRSPLATFATGGIMRVPMSAYALGGIMREPLATFATGGIMREPLATFATGGIMREPLATFVTGGLFASGGIMHSPLATFATGGIMHAPMSAYASGGIMRMPEYAFASGGIMHAPLPAYASGGIMHAPVSAFASGGIMHAPLSAYASGGIMRVPEYASGGIGGTSGLTGGVQGAAFNIYTPPTEKPAPASSAALDAILDMTKSVKQLVLLLEVQAIFAISSSTSGKGGLLGDAGKAGTSPGAAKTPEEARANTVLGKTFTKIGDIYSSVKDSFTDKGIGITNASTKTSTQKEYDLFKTGERAFAKDADFALTSPVASSTPSGLPSEAIGIATETATQTSTIAKSTEAVSSFTTEAISPATDAITTLGSSGLGSSSGLDQAATSAITSAFSMDTTTGAAANLATSLETAAFAAQSGGGSSSGGGGFWSSLVGAITGSSGAGQYAPEYMSAAKGGLMTPQGMVPLRSYAYGGITDKPQLALYGEGSLKEAYIPLPDGKTIPVMIKDVRGEIQAHVPLPDGRQLPVSLSGSGIEALRSGHTDKGRPGLFSGIDLGPTGLASLAPMPSKGLTGPAAALIEPPRGAIAEIEAKRQAKAKTQLGKEDDGGVFARFVRQSNKAEQIYAPGLAGVEELRKQFATSKFARGGVMTPFGELVPNRYSTGGITNRPQLALFGEGRKPEAYVPLADGRTIPVSIKSEGGQQRAYVPLPSGRTIPVSLKHDSYSNSTSSSSSSNTSSFAFGGVMYAGGDSVPIRAYADGGVAGSVDPYASGATAGKSMMPSSRPAGKRGAGDTFFVVENHGANVSEPKESKRGDNDREIRYIINLAKAEAKAEMTSDIANGRGGVSTALRARGLDSTRTLQRKG